MLDSKVKVALSQQVNARKAITGKIHNLMDMAIELKDYATQSMLKWFVDEQVEEDTARKILETLKRIENSPAGLYALDNELGKR